MYQTYSPFSVDLSYIYYSYEDHPEDKEKDKKEEKEAVKEGKKEK